MKTQQDIVNVLKDNPFLTENQIFIKAFNYNRNKSMKSNKSYAELLRRALRSGKISRFEAKIKGIRSTYFYFIPR